MKDNSLPAKAAVSSYWVKFETFVNDYFDKESSADGLLTVHQIAEAMNFSPNYLSDLLRIQTGQNTQQHIHEKTHQQGKRKAFYHRTFCK